MTIEKLKQANEIQIAIDNINKFIVSLTETVKNKRISITIESLSKENTFWSKTDCIELQGAIHNNLYQLLQDCEYEKEQLEIKFKNL